MNGWRIPLWAYGLFFLVAPPAAGGGGMAFPLMQALVAPAIAPWRRMGEALRAHWPTLAAATALLAWGLISTAWGGPSGLELGAKLFGSAAIGLAFACGAWAAPAERVRTLATIVLLSVSLLIALLAIEATTDMAINRAFKSEPVEPWVLARNPGKGVSALTMMSFAAAAMAVALGWRLWALGALAATAWLSLQFGQSANVAAFAVGLAAALAAALAPRIAVAGLLGAGALIVALAPLIAAMARAAPADALPFSWKARLAIWEFTGQRIAERPWLGWGLDRARAFDQPIVVDGIAQPGIPLHPHNMPLQIWLELGTVGATLAAITLGLAAWAWAKRPRSRGAGFAAGGAISAGLAYAAVSYGVWQEWWIAAQFTAAMACVVAARAWSLKAAASPPPRPPPA